MNKSFFLLSCLFAVLFVLSGDLCEASDQRSDTGALRESLDEELLSERLIHRLLDRDFSGLEQLQRKLWHSKDRLATGELKLARFYEAFDDPPLTELDILMARAEEWRRASPDSSLALLFLGKFYRVAFWHERRGLGASEGGDEEKGVIPGKMRRSIELLIAASKSAEPDPEVYSALMEAFYEVGLPREGERCVENMVKLEPTYLRGFKQRMRFFSPQFGGNPGEAERFSDRIAQSSRSVFGDGAYAVLAWSFLKVRGGKTLEGENFSWPRMRDGARELMRLFPKQREYVSLFMQSTFLASDFSALVSEFAKIKREWSVAEEKLLGVDDERDGLWSLVRELYYSSSEGILQQGEKDPYRVYAEGHLKEARVLHERLLEKAKASGSLDQQIYGLLDLARFHGVTGAFRLGLEYANQAFQLTSALPKDDRSDDLRGETVTFIGDYLSSMGYFKAAVPFYKKSRTLRDTSPRALRERVALGEVMFELGDRSAARKYILEALPIVQDKSYKCLRSDLYRKLSTVAIGEGKTEEGFRLARHSFHLSDRRGCISVWAEGSLLRAFLAKSEKTEAQRKQALWLATRTKEKLKEFKYPARELLGEMKMIHRELLLPSEQKERQELLNQAVALFSRKEMESWAMEEAALGLMYLQGEEKRLAAFYRALGVGVTEGMFHDIDKSFISLESVALSKLSKVKAGVVRSISDSYEAAARKGEMALQFDAASKIAQEYLNAGFHKMAVQWAQRGLDVSEPLSHRELSPDERSSLQRRTTALQEILVNGFVRLSRTAITQLRHEGCF